jgi:hypothetical protein
MKRLVLSIVLAAALPAADSHLVPAMNAFTTDAYKHLRSEANLILSPSTSPPLFPWPSPAPAARPRMKSNPSYIFITIRRPAHARAGCSFPRRSSVHLPNP